MSLSSQITIVEVGSRDGFQMEREFIPTKTKIEIINHLIQTGLRNFEVTSFVSPKAVPQMRDATEVVAGVNRVPGLCLAALVPNPKGAENAAQAGVDEIVVVVSATESHNKSNVNRKIAESLEGFESVAEIGAKAGIPLHGAVAVAFGCPFEGNVPPEQVGNIVERMRALGITEVTLGDTTGMATPPTVRQTTQYLKNRFPEIELALHFHNTRGIGLVNVYEALQLGYKRFESSIGGLGGCPFAPGATGNVATEDMVYLIKELGLDCGVDLEKLIESARVVEQVIGRTLPGQVMKAGSRLRRYPLQNHTAV
ncbi:MAG: hydroxymethylglutaryl-CoA lyase [Desulfobacterales bacterium]|nr:MAG: hydroxymethylglutaryl-CoA lyase [Desulfobacterales bacterium]